MVNYNSTDFNIKEFGSFYSKDKTIFRIFAPENKKMYLVLNNETILMNKNNYCFELTINEDLANAKYCYKNDDGVYFRDPFAYYSDDDYSYVLDKEKFIKEKVKINKAKDIIIYESSVRDFSCDDTYIGKYKRKLLAYTEDNLKINDNYSIGLDYLKQLGITYLQLMPIFDFDLDGADYNWGYNPIAYNYVNKDYIVDSNNPYAFINEVRKTINVLHENNIHVTFDVVFNHVYNYLKYDLDLMIPGHVFRLKEDGSMAQGTYCGNEIKSEDPFVRAYLIEMVERYIELFDVDGIRLDLMGILDYETVNEIYNHAKKIKNDFIVYGEGWNMGDVLSEDKRASSINANKISNIALFNDYYRDTLINYICGNDSIKESVKNILSANGNLNYKQSLNYVECHDNYTFFDRMIRFKGDDQIWINERRCKLALALVVLSRGIPFIHAGQEFLRTKNLVENSYNSNESINHIDWQRRVENNDIVEYFCDLVDIRKAYSEFRNDNTNVYFEDYYECIIYHLDNMMIIINPCKWDHTYKDGHQYDVIFDFDGKNNYKSDTLLIPAYSILICRQ